MRDAEEKVIDGVTYIVTPLGARDGINLTLRLGRILGPTLTELAQLAGQPAEAAKGKGLEVLGRAASGLLERATEAELRAVYEPLAKCTRLDNGDKKPLLADIFDVHFAGRLDAFAQWLAFALEVNLGPLAGMLGSVRPRPGGAAGA